ncbi:MAG: DUF4173 domain-containing protein, partial [Bacteroidetes bacterium]|nr:DUF4173 domain-containing protein [Bacteroidota bacterium]
MKKNDLILIITVAAYSILFYEQIAGINFLLFNILLLGMLLWKNKAHLFSVSWISIAACTLLTSVSVFIYGNNLSVIANIISLMLLSALSFNKKNSVIAGFLYAIYSEFSSIVFIIMDLIERMQNRTSSKSKNYLQRILLITGGFTIVLILFLLYRESNVLFKDFTKDINFDFISFSWIFFTVFGFILLYGFFYHNTIEPFEDLENSINNKLSLEKYVNTEVKGIRKHLKIEIELLAGIILLVVLNLLILNVNILDIVYLWAGKGLPKGITFSDTVHQSVGTLIFSIIIAISIILFLFRGDMNFYKKNKALKWLAMIWVLQNIIITISTIYRNQQYIAEYSLTYKRIGVYIFLLLAILGLLSTCIKIITSRSNWYLFRFNGWSFIIVLSLMTPINWDRIITNYNIKNSKEIDIDYLLKLSYENIPDLIQLNSVKPELFSAPCYQNTWDKDFSTTSADYKTFLNQLHFKIYTFLEVKNSYGWRSYCINRNKIYNEIYNLQKNQKLNSIDLSHNHLTTLAPISSLNNLKTLIFTNNNLKDISELSLFRELEKVNISSNNRRNIDSFPEMKKLKELNLSKNMIADFKVLEKLKNLETLNISNNGDIGIKYIPALYNLKSLDISGNFITNYTTLNKLKSLKTLFIQNAKNKQISNMSALENLEELHAGQNELSILDYLFFQKIC